MWRFWSVSRSISWDCLWAIFFSLISHELPFQFLRYEENLRNRESIIAVSEKDMSEYLRTSWEDSGKEENLLPFECRVNTVITTRQTTHRFAILSLFIDLSIFLTMSFFWSAFMLVVSVEYEGANPAKWSNEARWNETLFLTLSFTNSARG